MRCLLRPQGERHGVIDSARLVQALGQRLPRPQPSRLVRIACGTGRVLLALCAAFWVLVLGAILRDVLGSGGR